MYIFVTYQAIDFPTLALCLASIRQFIRPAPAKLVIVGPALPQRLAREVAKYDVAWLDEAKVIPGLTRDAMPEIPFPGRDLGPAYFQEFLPWALTNCSGTDLYAVIHAGCVFIKETYLVTKEALCLFIEGTVLWPQVFTARRLHGHFETEIAFSRSVTVYHREIVRHLMHRIQAPKPWKRFHEAVLDAVDLFERDPFSSANTYSWFAALHFRKFTELVVANTVFVPKDHVGRHAEMAQIASQGNTRALIYKSEYLIEFAEFLHETNKYFDVSNARIMLDIGSRDAEVSLAARRDVDHVYAFECNPDGLALCRSNVKGVADVTLVEKAVSNQNGPVDFYAIDPMASVTPHTDGNIGASSLFPADPAYPYERYAQKKITVEATTLADWARSAGVDSVDLVWMDLQGAALQALEGMGDLLNTVQAIYTEIEYQQMYLGQPSDEALRNFLLARGFRLHRKLNTTPWFGNELFLREGLQPLPSVLTMVTLGENGRFGNQLFQYAFLRLLAHHHGQRVQTTPWIGQYLFGHEDPYPIIDLPRAAEGRDFPDASFPQHLFDEPARDRDIWGFFQFHSSHYAAHREFFRSLFKPTPVIEAPLKAAFDRLVPADATLVALHIRRGDYKETGMFFAAPSAWYQEVLEKVWPTLKNPVLYIATDDPQKVLPEFAQYKPLSAADLNVIMPRAPFYPDFWALAQAHVLAISNSSFSFIPAMLAERGTQFYRPHLHEKRLLAFDPWNAEPLLHRELAHSIGSIFGGSDKPENAPAAPTAPPTASPPASGKVTGVQIHGSTTSGAPIVSFGKPAK